MKDALDITLELIEQTKEDRIKWQIGGTGFETWIAANPLGTVVVRADNHDVISVYKEGSELICQYKIKPLRQRFDLYDTIRQAIEPSDFQQAETILEWFKNER